MADDDLRRLAADLSNVPKETWPFVGRALGVTSKLVKNDWNESLVPERGWRSAFKHLGKTVDYTVSANEASTAVESEIGPNIVRYEHLGAAFAGWFEEGQANIPAKHLGEKALRANEEDFERGIANAIDDGLRKAGL